MTGHWGSNMPFDPRTDLASEFMDYDGEARATVDLSAIPSDNEALALVPEAYATANNLIPLHVEDGTLVIASVDPGDAAIMSEVQVLSRHRVRALAAPRTEIH